VSIYERGAPPPARRLIDIFAETVRRYPDAPAIDDGQVCTYRECAGRVLDAAEELRRLDVRAGDRVGVRMPSGGAERHG
jgi:acyl-CoA synthetase (AMP-forming)/AMP-acid ligase II